MLRDALHELLVAGLVVDALLRVPHVGLRVDHDALGVTEPRAEGRVEPAQVGAGALDPLLGLRRRLGSGVSHPSYLMLTCGFFVCGFHIGFITTHLPPYLTDLGFSGSLAAWSLALIGLFNVIGAYTASAPGGTHSKRLLLSGIYAGPALLLFALFLIVPTTPAALVLLFGAGMGLLWLSTVPPTSGLVAVMFGTRHVGMLFGFVFLSAPDRRVPRRLARRRGLRGHGRVPSDVVALDRTRTGRGDGPSPDLERRAPEWAPSTA